LERIIVVESYYYARGDLMKFEKRVVNLRVLLAGMAVLMTAGNSWAAQLMRPRK
jgi:hypothetical protein